MAALKLNVWQARALSEAMEKHDDASDESLRSSYANVETTETTDGDRLVVVRWEDDHKRVFWHDGQDVTDDYPEL